jgi:hypothetical protein
MKIRPATSTVGQMVITLAGRHQRAGLGAGARDMLERGVADAITFPWGSIGLFGIDKVVKYHMDVPLYVTPFVWVMNKGKYDAMSTTQKKVIDDHCTSEWAEKVGRAWADFEFAAAPRWPRCRATRSTSSRPSSSMPGARPPRPPRRNGPRA